MFFSNAFWLSSTKSGFCGLLSVFHQVTCFLISRFATWWSEFNEMTAIAKDNYNNWDLYGEEALSLGFMLVHSVNTAQKTAHPGTHNALNYLWWLTLYTQFCRSKWEEGHDCFCFSRRNWKEFKRILHITACRNFGLMLS